MRLSSAPPRKAKSSTSPSDSDDSGATAVPTLGDGAFTAGAAATTAAPGVPAAGAAATTGASGRSSVSER